MRLDERTLEVARYLLDRHSAKAVFYGRFVSVEIYARIRHQSMTS